MTLVLSYVNSLFSVQVADRKIVLAEEGLPEYDPTANKTVVYGALDGLVSISFAGHAYIDGMTTDEWLATFLWGQPIFRGPDGVRPALHSFGPRKNHWSVGETMVKLTSHINKSLRRSQGLELTIAGWQLAEDGPPVPVLYLLEKRAGQDGTEQSDAVRYRDPSRYFETFGQSGVDLEKDIIREAWNPFRERGRPPNIEEAEAALVDVVRITSQTHNGVGEHVLAVCIPRFDLGAPYSRFHPGSPHLKRAPIPGRELVAEVAFVPWIVADFVTAQSYQTNDLIVRLGNIEFTAHGAGVPSKGFGFASTNPRPPQA